MTVIPIKPALAAVRITRKGSRFFQLLRDGYDADEAMRLAAGLELVEAPARQDAGETEQTEQQLRDRIEKQVAQMLAAARELLQATRVAKARSEFLLDAVSGKGSGAIQ